MKKIYLSLHYITLLLFCQVALCCGALFSPVSALDTNNFYFDSFEADYYLEKAENGTSALRVVENLTAVFPNYNQNKGICRAIPFTNQGGKNITLDHLDKSNITVLRNDQPEPIYSIDKHSTYYYVCTGTEAYLTGTQKYTLEYTFTNVITEFTENDKSWQELYWDTNGTGWEQRFSSLTARIHLPDGITWNGESSCYVGASGEKGQSRCITEPSSDGKLITFTTSSLKSGENLTFDLTFPGSSFVMPTIKKSYLAFVGLGIVVLLCGLALIRPIKNYKKSSENRRFHKSLFIKPEYQPSKKYSLIELADIYIGKKHDVKVAVLLQMIVYGRVELVKGKKRVLTGQEWSLKVKSVSDLRDEERIVLEILNGGASISDGYEIALTRHYSTSHLQSLGRQFEKIGVKEAQRDGLLSGDPKKRTFSFAVLLLFPLFGVGVYALGADYLTDEIFRSGTVYVASNLCILGALGAALLSCFVAMALYSRTNKFIHHTRPGIEASRYLDGLKLYMKMAEKDRMKLLQSVKGADTSPEGVVHLYEKLLPYAALFGIEESWMRELERFYKEYDIEMAGWYLACHHMGIRNFNQTIHTASTLVSSATSSSSSGAGGGGFSGGGGGGGGGGGR